jgi:hypothetical protein
MMPFLKPDHKPLIQHPSGHPVDVIVSYKATGEFIPLYFQVEDDMQELFKFQISAIKSIKDKYMVKVYECSFDAFGQHNTILLCFDITRCLWSIG